MNRPKILHVGGVLYWTIRTYNPDTMVLKDADSTPTVTVRKNGASTGDSVTITKRSATAGLYDCVYNPAGEVEGDEFTIEESATVTGTTTGAATYSSGFDVTVVALERGTNGAITDPQDVSDVVASSIMDGIGDWPSAVAVIQNGLALQSLLVTVAGYIDTEIAAIKAKTDNLPSDPADASDIAAAFSTVNTTLVTIDTEIADIQNRLPAALVGGRMDASVGAMAANTLTANALASDAVTEIAGAVSGGGGASVSDIFSESMSTYTTPGTAGYYLSLIMADNINRELQPETNELVYITRGDSYDNVANAKKTFAVSKNYTGWTGAFVIRHRVTDSVLLSVAVEVTSATLLTIALSATDTAFASLASAEEYGPHPFAIEMVSGSSRQEGPSGIAIVVQDQAR